MFLFMKPKLAIMIALILFAIPITATLLNRYTPLAWDPALMVSFGAWLVIGILIWASARARKRRKQNSERKD